MLGTAFAPMRESRSPVLKRPPRICGCTEARKLRSPSSVAYVVARIWFATCTSDGLWFVPVLVPALTWIIPEAW